MNSGYFFSGSNKYYFDDAGNLSVREINVETGSIVSPQQNLSFVVANKQAISINQNGQIGINTSPKSGYTLAVNGKMKTHELVVTIDPNEWADFVFDENYKLMPLGRLEKIINKQRHLPDIPSEKEVGDKGISVGKMQSKLLQKIEELTLYTIQQHKQISQQKQYINNLEKKVTELRSMKNEIEKIKQVLLNK